MTILLVTLMVNGIAAIVTGKLPMTVNQILWENILIDLLSALALSAECPTEEIMQKRPVSSKEHIITKTMLWNFLTPSIISDCSVAAPLFQGGINFTCRGKCQSNTNFQHVHFLSIQFVKFGK